MKDTRSSAGLSTGRLIATIAVHDLENARDFYENTLGLGMASRNAAGMVFAGDDGSRFGIYESPAAGTGLATSVWWTVDNVEAVADGLRAKGVLFKRYDDMPGTKRQGDVHVTGERKAAWFEDIDGNILGFGNY